MVRAPFTRLENVTASRVPTVFVEVTGLPESPDPPLDVSFAYSSTSVVKSPMKPSVTATVPRALTSVAWVLQMPMLP